MRPERIYRKDTCIVMYFCDNYSLAVAFCVVTMFCWGSWGNTQKLAGKTWRYELFYWKSAGTGPPECLSIKGFDADGRFVGLRGA